MYFQPINMSIFFAMNHEKWNKEWLYEKIYLTTNYKMQFNLKGDFHMNENNNFRPNIIDFTKMILSELTEQKYNLNKAEQEILLNKFFDLYNDGFWDTESDETIKNDIYQFVMGFTCYKTYKNLLEDD